MLKTAFVLLSLLSPFFVHAGDETPVHKKILSVVSQDLSYVFLPNENSKLFYLVFYFGDGALSDPVGKEGLTDLSFSLMTLGTKNFTQKQIADELEYYGLSMNSSVTHEYALVSMSGMNKDIAPTLKKVCHLFAQASYPARELAVTKKQIENSLQASVSRPSALVETILRSESLAGTPYSKSAGARVKPLRSMTSKELRTQLDYFKEKVKKKIFFAGTSANFKDVQNMISQECGFNAKTSTFQRKLSFVKDAKLAKSAKPLVFVPVPKATQAQIRIGGVLDQTQVLDHSLMALASGYLGAGFTSKLIQEVRVKRGLAYSASAMAVRQRDYGRVNVATSTKNSSVVETITLLRKILTDAGTVGSISEEELNHTKNYLSGNYLLSSETIAEYLKNILYLDHLNLPYDELYRFPEIIERYTTKDESKAIANLFPVPVMVTVVLGDPTILPDLKKLGPVKVVKYQDYL